MSRMFTALGERQDLNRMALAFVLTTRGIPQIFYGTEVLMSNKGTEDHGVIRSDFPGGWPGDTKNAFTGQGLSDDERAMQDYTRKLLQWRRTAPAIRDGKLTHYVPTDDLYVYFRRNDAQNDHGDPEQRATRPHRRYEALPGIDRQLRRRARTCFRASRTSSPRVSRCLHAAPRSSNCSDVNRCRSAVEPFLPRCSR